MGILQISSEDAEAEQHNAPTVGWRDYALREVQECRRGEERAETFFRPCCLEVDGQATLGLIRNLSQSGALIETEARLEPGAKLTYWWDSVPPLVARVAWREGRKIGIRNQRLLGDDMHVSPSRSARVPCTLDATLWTSGRCFDVLALNISVGGMMVFGVPPLANGTLASIEFAGLCQEAAKVVWSQDGALGLRFSTPLRPRELMRLLAI